MDQLGLNWQGLVAQIVNFGLLLLVLRAVAYKPILKMLDERSERIRESMQRAEQIKVEAARTEEEFGARLLEARRQGQEIVARANQAAERIHADAEERARRDAEQFLAKAHSEIDRDRQKVAAELRGQVADMAILIANRLARTSLDPAAHRALIEDALTEAEQAKLN